MVSPTIDVLMNYTIHAFEETRHVLLLLTFGEVRMNLDIEQ